MPPKTFERNPSIAATLATHSTCSQMRAVHTDGPPFNFCRLLAGPRGYAGVFNRNHVQCQPLPPRESAPVRVQLQTMDEPCVLTLWLCDTRHVIVSDRPQYPRCTKTNLRERRNRFFVERDPRSHSRSRVCRGHARRCRRRCTNLRPNCALPASDALSGRLGPAQNRVWNLRKAASVCCPAPRGRQTSRRH